jgi:membrane fusion protein, macrolide-specific efflux system
MAGLDSLKIQAELQQSQLLLLQTDLDRQKQLFARQLVSEKDYDAAQAAVRHQGLALRGLDAQIRQSKGIVTKAQKSLSLTKLTSPIDATVVNLLMSPGQTVIATQQAPVVLKLANLQKMMGKIYIPQGDADKVAVGMRVEYGNSDQTDLNQSSRIKNVAPIPEKIQGVNFYSAQFEIDNSAGLFKVDMALRVRATRKEQQSTLLIPLSCLGYDKLGKPQVFRLDPGQAGGKWVLVEAGNSNQTHVAIKSGLSANDRVLPIASLDMAGQ